MDIYVGQIRMWRESANVYRNDCGYFVVIQIEFLNDSTVLIYYYYLNDKSSSFCNSIYMQNHSVEV